ncbi:protein lin-37 homolog [Maniola jurtina]|uniref:protein lin-37 homolog n=1 Tax=Maniola jurtina TaxID=191418 RepID=UPI001E68E4C8|nr:protein lin-37 homolog [Maniola jurtina]
MPLSKRRRLLASKKNAKPVPNSKESEEQNVARGRLKGALLEMMEPPAEESDASTEYVPAKRERQRSSPKQLAWYERPYRRHIPPERKEHSSGEDEKSEMRQKSPPRQSYVLKLFDRSVDLSQFSEDSPLYPICRAWIANQPKANYKSYFEREPEEASSEDSIQLPGPEGPVISRIPSLLPEQKACSKDNINLDYSSAPPPSKEQLLQQHTSRWAAVRGAWLQRGARVEARYSAAQAVLNNILNNQ